MTYSLSNLIRDAMRYQGIDAFDIRTATDGSATTFIDTTLEDKYGDDELKDGTILVVRTTGGVSPQDKFSRISEYLESSTTATFDTITDAIVAGNTCMLISPEYPLRTLIELANDALRDCGEISIVDSVSTTTIDGATEYTLPVSHKRLIDIYLQTELNDADSNLWIKLTNWRVLPSAGNVDSTIIFPQSFTAGYVLQFVYNGLHPTVDTYSSPVNEAINSQLAALTLADKIMQWHGVTNENQNYANKILSELADAKRMYPIRREKPRTKFFTFPKTS